MEFINTQCEHEDVYDYAIILDCPAFALDDIEAWNDWIDCVWGI